MTVVYPGHHCESFSLNFSHSKYVVHEDFSYLMKKVTF